MFSALTTARFWVSTGERALKTFAQTLLVIWPISDGMLGLFDVDWQKSLSVAGLAAVMSMLTSIASAPIGPDGSPSLVGEPPKEPAELVEDDPGDHVLDGDPDEIPASRFAPPRVTDHRPEERG